MSSTKRAPKAKTAQPLYDRVLITQKIPESISAGGIYLVETTVKKTTEGIVYAIGPKCDELAIGDYVSFGEYAGNPVTVDGIECLIMRQSDILMKH